ncbi:MAG: hypothetical protein HC906_08755 [Bacteroidales bacterium]|nr:hypothetical protein [Bacteroidales bacterium]
MYRFHIYGGIFCSVYLFIVGLSAIHFQHHLLPEQPKDTIKYVRNLAIDASQNPEKIAENTLKQLNLIGHYPPWDFFKDENHFNFKVYRPARQYNIEINLRTGKTHISRIHFASGAIISALHTAIFVELDDPLLNIWAYYGQLSAITSILVIGTSIYFWFVKSIQKNVIGSWRVFREY